MRYEDCVLFGAVRKLETVAVSTDRFTVTVNWPASSFNMSYRHNVERDVFAWG